MDYASISKNKFPLIPIESFDENARQITGIAEDSEQRVIFSTQNGKNFAFNNHIEPEDLGPELAIDQFSITHLSVDRNDRIWIVVGDFKRNLNSLYYYDQDLQKWIATISTPQNILSVFHLSNSRILLTTRNGVKELLSDDSKYYLIDCPELGDFKNLPFYKIFENQKGQFFFSANFDRIIIYQIVEEGLQYLKTINQVGDVKGFCKTCLDTNLWIATSGGLIQLNTNDLSFNRLSQSNGNLLNESYNTVILDNSGKLWLKTQNELIDILLIIKHFDDFL